MGKPFFPTDKPKSFVIFLSAGLSGLLICAPIMGLGIFFGAEWLVRVGQVGFFLCWLVAFSFGLLFNFRHFTGQYRTLEDREWKDQMW